MSPLGGRYLLAGCGNPSVTQDTRDNIPSHTSLHDIALAGIAGKTGLLLLQLPEGVLQW